MQSLFAVTMQENVMPEPIDLYTLSKEKVAPVLYAYVSWVIKEAQKRNIHTLYFLARDGYVLHEIAELICQEQKLPIECRYLYCSRMSLRTPTYHLIGEEAFRLIFMGGYHVSLQSIFDRVNLPEDLRYQVMQQAGIPDDTDLKKELSYLEIENYRNQLTANKCFTEHILNISKESYLPALEYFRQEQLFDQEQLAIVDSGWTGSMQRSLRQLLQSAGWNKKIVGFYFGMFASPKSEDGEYLCFYFKSRTNKKNKVLFCNNLFECFLSAPHGMTTGYQKNTAENKIVPVCREAPQHEQLQRIQEQIAGIVAGAKKLIFEKQHISMYECQKILRKLMGMPDASTVHIYGQFLFCDDTTEKYCLALAEAEHLKTIKQQLISQKLKKRFKHQKQQLLFWDYGVIALISNPIKRIWYWLNIYLWKELTYSIKRE